MSVRYRGPGLKLFFWNAALSYETECNVSNGNVHVSFNVTIKEKSFQIALPIFKHSQKDMMDL